MPESEADYFARLIEIEKREQVREGRVPGNFYRRLDPYAGEAGVFCEPVQHPNGKQDGEQ